MRYLRENNSIWIIRSGSNFSLKDSSFITALAQSKYWDEGENNRNYVPMNYLIRFILYCESAIKGVILLFIDIMPSLERKWNFLLWTRRNILCSTVLTHNYVLFQLPQVTPEIQTTYYNITITLKSTGHNNKLYSHSHVETLTAIPNPYMCLCK